MAKQVKPKLRNGRIQIRIRPNIKVLESQNKKKITKNSQSEVENKMLNTKSTKMKTGKEKLEVKADELNPIIPEVIFNPSTGGVACEEGRKGDKQKNCWGCRNRENKE